MKQEKKPTTWSDIVSADKNELHQWQMLDRSHRGGLKKGEIIIYPVHRSSGKSVFWMGGSTVFGGSSVTLDGSPWGKWENTFVWPWLREESVDSGKKIWGRVMVRKHRVMASYTQYATKKEVFQRKLKGDD